MGYNTIAFLLNDLSHELEKSSPKTAAYALAHPPFPSDIESGRWRKLINAVADKNNEPRPHSQALQVLPTFHASERKFLMAGGNCINELKLVGYRKSRKTGKLNVTLELPDWFTNEHK